MSEMGAKLTHRIFGQHFLARSAQAGTLLEIFLISAVASVLVIRLYLAIAYRYLAEHAPSAAALTPADGLHIAHMLWGGLFMLAGFVVALAFLGRPALGIAAVLGGIGFGTFIDEIGKFITQDNNYFFQPAVALIYITFVLLFLAFQAIARPRILSARDSLANALEYTQLAVLRDFRAEDRRQALAQLERCNPNDRLVAALRDVLQQTECREQGVEHGFIAWVRGRFAAFYRWLVAQRWFAAAVVAFFVAQSISNLYQTFEVVTWSVALVALIAVALVGGVLIGLKFERDDLPRAASAGFVVAIAALTAWGILLHVDREPISLVRWIQLISPTASGVLVVFGTVLIHRSRLAAYWMFHHAVLLAVLITQVFAFYEAQVMAVTSLAIHILVLAVLRYMISQEELNRSRPASQQAEEPEPTRTVSV